MLRFVHFDDRNTSAPAPVQGAYMLGQDQVAIAGEVVREDAIVRCEKTSPDAAGCALQVEIDESVLAQMDGQPTAHGLTLHPLGTLVLQTCLLPERERPYRLALELARHRIMLVLTKLEQWHAFEHADDSIPMKLFDEARACFIQALVLSGPDSSHDDRVDALALRSLVLGIEASERLTIGQTTNDFPKRMSGELYDAVSDDMHLGAPADSDREKRPTILHPTRGGVVLASKPMLGTLVSPKVFAEPTAAAVTKSCDFITVPMRWIEMEPAEGEYDFSRTDRWIEWAIRTAKIPVVAGPLIDFRSVSAPDWLYIWENDYETLRELVYEHIKALVTRYRRTVSRWTVCSGFHCGDHFKLSFEQMMDLTRICVLVAKKLHPRGKIQIEINQPWGEYHTRDRASLPPLLYAEMLSQAGVQLDAFSVRVQMGAARPGLQARDLMAFSDLLDRYAMLDRPIALSAVGVPAGIDASETKDNEHTPGSWRGQWDERTQADWLDAFMGVALSKPYIESISWHELADAPGTKDMPMGGLMNGKGEPRMSLDRMSALKRSIASGALPSNWNTETLLSARSAPAAAK